MDAIPAFPPSSSRSPSSPPGPDITNVMIAIGVSLRADLRAHARAAVLAEREKEYVIAARALGQPGFAILTREILPNCWRRCWCS